MRACGFLFMQYLRHNNTANSRVLDTSKNQHRKEPAWTPPTFASTPSNLTLSTSPTNEPGALHLGGCMVGALEELEDEGVSFEEWLEESFYTGDEDLLSNLTRSILYAASEEEAVRTFLQEHGFDLPTLRIADLADVDPTDASGIPPLVNETDEAVDRLFELIDLYIGPADDGALAGFTAGRTAPCRSRCFPAAGGGNHR